MRTVAPVARLTVLAAALLVGGCGRIGYQGSGGDAAVPDGGDAGGTGAVCAPACGLDETCVERAGASVCECAEGMVRLTDRTCDRPLVVTATLAAGARRSFAECLTSADAEVRLLVRTERVPEADRAALRTADPVASGVARAGVSLELAVPHAPEAHLFVYAVAYRELADRSFDVSVKEGELFARPLFAERTFAHAGRDDNESLVYVPDRYAADATETFPVILFLHGWGGAVNRDSADQLPEDDGLLERILSQEARYAGFPFVVVAPHCRQDVQGGCWGWANHTLAMGALENAAAGLRLDLSRIYVTGLSTGGQGTFELASRYPSRFAAAVPIAATYADTTPICEMLRVPVWAFHGDADTLQPPSNTETYVDTLRTGCGAAPFEPPALTLVPCRTASNNHCGWIEAYDGTHRATVDGTTSVFDWMLARSL